MSVSDEPKTVTEIYFLRCLHNVKSSTILDEDENDDLYNVITQHMPLKDYNYF